MSVVDGLYWFDDEPPREFCACDYVHPLASPWQLIDYDWNPDTGIATFLYSHETHGTRQVEREQRRYWHNQGDTDG